jgi:hypothetical protein
LRANKLSLVERLADDLAHEIKNPLHSMGINLEVLRRRLSRLEPQTNEDLLRYASVLGFELERVNRRIDLLLRVARPNPASEELSTFTEVLDELGELLELECRQHDVRFRMDLPTAILRSRVPRAPARQLVLTLALRTLDTLPRGGTLIVSSALETDRLLTRFQGLTNSARPTALTASIEEGNELAIAESLAARLGGRLEVTAPKLANGADSAVRQYVLSLPLDVAPDATLPGTSPVGIG